MTLVQIPKFKTQGFVFFFIKKKELWENCLLNNSKATGIWKEACLGKYLPECLSVNSILAEWITDVDIVLC